MTEDGTGREDSSGLLCCLGDLVEDIAVWLSSDVRAGTDTPASIHRRQGGSAANVAVRAAQDGTRVRFIGRVGGDATGVALISELQRTGVDTRVQTEGRTGTVVVLVDADGERTMLPDRAAATELTGVSESNLDDVTWLHVPAYSLVIEPLATTAREAIERVQGAGGTVSLDASSVAIIDEMGVGVFSTLVGAIRPDVLLCNDDEATALAIHRNRGHSGAGLTVVKAGPSPAIAYARGDAVASVPAVPVEEIRDTTGAGDAFAAGFITARMASRPVADAISNGHQVAARLLRQYAP